MRRHKLENNTKLCCRQDFHTAVAVPSPASLSSTIMEYFCNICNIFIILQRPSLHQTRAEPESLQKHILYLKWGFTRISSSVYSHSHSIIISPSMFFQMCKTFTHSLLITFHMNKEAKSKLNLCWKLIKKVYHVCVRLGHIKFILPECVFGCKHKLF